jgi:hypothetical protein
MFVAKFLDSPCSSCSDARFCVQDVPDFAESRDRTPGACACRARRLLQHLLYVCRRSSQRPNVHPSSVTQVLSYIVSPKTCHRFVGYLEEEAVLTYTHAIQELEKGHLPEWYVVQVMRPTDGLG